MPFKIKLLALTSLIIFTDCKKVNEADSLSDTPRGQVTVFSIGDSTMSDYDIAQLSMAMGGTNYPLRGWMMIREFLRDDILIHNAAVSGQSSKSFRDEGYWKNVIDQVKAGDYVFIQFGHNDVIKDTVHYTDPRTTFRNNLIGYVTETKAKGAYPVLFTSIPYRFFDHNGKLFDGHGDYITVVRELAAELKVPLVDLNKTTTDLVQNLGPEESKKIYLWIEPGVFTQLPDGKQDNTHLNIYGATKVAELAAKGLKELNLPLTKL